MCQLRYYQDKFPSHCGLSTTFTSKFRFRKMYIISFGFGATVMCCILKVSSHGVAVAAIFCVFYYVAAESFHTVWLRQRYSNAMLVQNNLPQLHKIGLEPIYLRCCCCNCCHNHCHCRTVSTTPLVIIESNCNDKQECVPVGCVPPAAVAVLGGLHEPPPQSRPPPMGAEPPPPGADPPEHTPGADPREQAHPPWGQNHRHL